MAAPSASRAAPVRCWRRFSPNISHHPALHVWQCVDAVLAIQHQISKASDVYAFGMLWWEMVQGQLLWPNLTAEQIHKRVTSKQLPTFESLDVNPGVKVTPCLRIAHVS